MSHRVAAEVANDAHCINLNAALHHPDVETTWLARAEHRVRVHDGSDVCRWFRMTAGRTNKRRRSSITRQRPRVRAKAQKTITKHRNRGSRAGAFASSNGFDRTTVWTPISRRVRAPGRALGQCLVLARRCLSISLRDCSARAAPIAVSTSSTSSGGGKTAGRPNAAIHNSRVHPRVWWR